MFDWQDRGQMVCLRETMTRIYSDGWEEGWAAGLADDDDGILLKGKEDGKVLTGILANWGIPFRAKLSFVKTVVLAV